MVVRFNQNQGRLVPRRHIHLLGETPNQDSNEAQPESFQEDAREAGTIRKRRRIPRARIVGT
ncbi:hypothetical protein V1477_007558 [Vespula maculifrons]|uniref:Uncharacterized protein n=1 Tax=Vespula maculifrons TaxID=7453 RepID=A0ABD2CIU4_VESMC